MVVDHSQQPAICHSERVAAVGEFLTGLGQIVGQFWGQAAGSGGGGELHQCLQALSGGYFRWTPNSNQGRCDAPTLIAVDGSQDYIECIDIISEGLLDSQR